MNESRPLDTSVEAESVQVEIFHKMLPEERLRRGLDLSALVRRTLAEGVRLRHPQYTQDQVRLAVIRLTLPPELFAKAYPHALDIVP